MILWFVSSVASGTPHLDTRYQSSDTRGSDKNLSKLKIKYSIVCHTGDSFITPARTCSVLPSACSLLRKSLSHVMSHSFEKEFLE